MIRDPLALAEVLGDLRRLGVRVALDDFGTGFSALTHLADLPIDTLKIDRTFVIGIGTSRRAERIASAVIGIAHRLDLDLVAEGVETLPQLQFLRDQGCPTVQGYLIGRPAPMCHWAGITSMRDALPASYWQSGPDESEPGSG